MRRSAVWIGAALLAAAVGGCSSEDLPDVGGALSDAKDALKGTIDRASGSAGSAKVQLDQPVDVPACYVRFTAFSDGRPAMVQIQSYRSASDETFPAVFLHGVAQAGAVEELAGQSVPAEMYVMTAKGGPLWHSPDGQPVQVRIASVADGQMEASIESGELIQAATDRRMPVSGTFTCRVLE